MGGVFFELTLIICIASVLSIIFRFFKQPPMLAYIATGILIGPIGKLQLNQLTQLEQLGQFGITLLLFILGLELKFSEIKSVSKTVLSVSFLQMIFVFITGSFLGYFFGFSLVASFYIGAAVSFSSTIFV